MQLLIVGAEILWPAAAQGVQQAGQQAGHQETVLEQASAHPAPSTHTRR
jgi:hypothetical protein